MFSLLTRALMCAVLFTFSQAVSAAKTDIVFLKNGDRVTGEVKSLFRGKLELSTDHMGTVFIEWDDIDELVSEVGQSVELTNGQRFFGPLNKAESDNMMMIETEQGAVGVGTMDIVSMYPVEAGFWGRLDLSASLGFSWDKASSVGKYNLGIDGEYRDPKFITRAGFSMEVTTQNSEADTSRSNLTLTHIAFRGNKRFLNYFSNMETNDELGLDLRALVGAGYGWAPIRSNRNWFALGAGLDVNREIPQNGEAQNNLEAVGTLIYEYYKYSNPERRFNVELLVFPSITDFGRVRAKFNTDYRLEFIDDLFWVLEYFTVYDSDPISEGASNVDYGVISSVSYKF